VSDWDGVHDTEEAVRGGLDIEMEPVVTWQCLLIDIISPSHYWK
jgi:hypothetical protein